MTTTEPKLRHRFLEIESPKATDNTIEFAFSSETPVQRMYGNEVLSHDENHVDLTRLNAGAPLLFNHQPDVVLGVVERAWIENQRGRAVIKWGNSAKAQEIREDVEGGILRGVSVGYQVNEMSEDDNGDMRATSWVPHELSIASIPADYQSVGIGRSKTTITKMTSTPVSNNQPINTHVDEFSQETESFSLIRACQDISSGRGLQGREREVNEELQHRSGKKTQGFFVPDNAWGQRDYVVGTASAGGNLVGTQHLADRFVDLLRTRLAVADLGATMLPSLVGNVDIPNRQTSSTAYWIGGDGADSVTESTGTLGKISLSPKTVGCYSKFSYLMDLQATPEIENLIRNDFIAVIAEAIDLAAINGSGSSNQPRGILNTTGIGSVAGGTNGLAPTLDHLINLKKEVSIDNADVSTAGYLTNTKVEAALSTLKDDQSGYLLNPYGAPLGDARINGRRLVVSNNVPSNLSKGSGSNLSAIIY